MSNDEQTNLDPLIELCKPINVPLAISHINHVFEDAITSGKHKPGDWRTRGEIYNWIHLAMHWHGIVTDDKNEDHLANLICRALLLLQLRLESTK